MTSLLCLMAVIWFSAKRTGYAEQILQANWDELSEEMQNRLITNKRNFIIAIGVFLIFFLGDMMHIASQLQELTGQQ